MATTIERESSGSVNRKSQSDMRLFRFISPKEIMNANIQPELELAGNCEETKLLVSPEIENNSLDALMLKHGIEVYVAAGVGFDHRLNMMEGA